MTLGENIKYNQSMEQKNKGIWEKDEKRDKEISKLSKKLSQTKIASKYNISRQRVNQILKRIKKSGGKVEMC